MIDIDYPQRHQAFLKSDRPHVLMITNHGIHQWQVIPGLPDTGGQNVFVNQFTQTLVDLGFKVTIANRGGYAHPNTGEWRGGLRYKDAHQRIIYLQDNFNQFVRKEDMAEHIPALLNYLDDFLTNEQADINLIISHYWDAAKLGADYNQQRRQPVKHIWAPHSLGAIKKRNVAKERWAELRIDERIEIERSLISQFDGYAATSSAIRESLQNDYGCSESEIIFLPPSIDTDRYHPRAISNDHRVWDFLCQHSGLSVEEIRRCKIVTEISRTDTTKRKDVLIKAFALAHQEIPNSFLVVSIDANEEELAQELKNLIDEHDIQNHTAVVGYVRDILPNIYAITDVYCTPSIMEGFGMSAQEAAATRVAVVASNKVPFVTEYLLDSQVEEIGVANNGHPLRQGRGAIVAPADEVDGFAQALSRLLADDSLREQMAENAYNITIPRFTWNRMVSRFLDEIDVAPN